MILKAIRTNCHTGKETDVFVVLEKWFYKKYKEWWWIVVEGGVTGWESIMVNKVTGKDWHACTGTKGRWDTLYIPAEEMMKLKGDDLC